MVELRSEPLMADKIVFVYIGETWQKCSKQLVATFFNTAHDWWQSNTPLHLAWKEWVG